LIEPFLHLAGHPAAAERLARDVAGRLGRTHREPPTILSSAP
jgi:hypothetical protein